MKVNSSHTNPNTPPKSAHVPPEYGKPFSLPPFEKVDASAIHAFEEELGIKIPSKIYESVQMYKFGYYFSSKDGFMGDIGSPKFYEMLDGKSNLVAFGHRGYGFNSYHFELYYINNALGYELEIPFGGAFMDNDAVAKEISNALQKLPGFIEQYKDSDGKTMTLIVEKGASGQIVDKYQIPPSINQE